MLRKRTSTSNIDAAIGRSVDYELTIADIARRSERRAWMIACVAVAMSLVLAGGYFYMLPLKEKVPFLVMADAYTGNATVARLDENFRNRSISTSEAINRGNVAHFVMMRESYDVAMMNLRDWRAVHSMASPEVGAAYGALHAKQNPESPYNTYGPGKSIRVRILSIVLIGGGGKIPPKGATVRFQRSLYDKSTGASRPLDSKIATLVFTYNLNLKMDEPDRIENPLGFQVTSYQVDNDFAPAPALETMIQPDPFVAAAPAPIVQPMSGPAQVSDAAIEGDVASGEVSAGRPPADSATPAIDPPDNANGASSR